MVNRHHLSLLTWLIFLVACDDIASTQTPTLIIEPDAINFAKPAPGEDEASRALTIRNDGVGDLIVAGVSLIEDDSIVELSLLDGEDWTGRVIPAGASEQLRVSWRVRDARSDVGRLILVHNAGVDAVVPITTPDIDPRLVVRSVPEAMSEPVEAVIEMSGASLGRTQRAVITLESGSVAALAIDRICLLDADGACLEEQSDASGAFTICQGTPPSPDACEAPAVEQPLQFEETHLFSAFFTPPDNQPNVRLARVLVESNAAQAPQFIIKLRGQVCVRETAGDVCDGCGDGVIDEGETCDDGNVEDEDECRNDCTQPVCGDGQLREGVEACDDGNDDDTDECLSNCEVARCGDGVIQEGVETCDDGNDVDTDSCTASCQEAVCGDGVVQEGVEGCDDGDQIDTNGCLNNCQPARCGDGVVLAFIEDCDDGNEVNTDGCLSDCRIARCGDGAVHEGVEVCDDGNAITDACAYGEAICEVCDAMCQLSAGVTSRCGDGQVDEDHEACDDGNAETEECAYGEEACVVCDAQCANAVGATSFCGDGRTDAANGEECDEGGAGNGCLANCRQEPPPPNNCGDGVLDAGEECDSEADSYCDVETCQCSEPAPGPGEYRDRCDRGRDCASGLCVPGAALDLRGRPVATAGYCTALCRDNGACPGVDRCSTVNAAEEGCPTPATPFIEDGQLDVCLQNETGIPCRDGADCLPGGICLTPPNPPGPLVVVQPMCAARCDNDAECPVGFACDVIQTNNGPASVCRPAVQVTACPAGAAGPPACSNSRICPGNLTPQEHFTYSVCIEYGAGGAQGVCSCACADVLDCPTGFACSNVDLGLNFPERPGVCLPIAGYTCPTGQGGQCLSDSCLASDGGELSRCTTSCNDRFDCPTGYDCRQVGGVSVCLP